MTDRRAKLRLVADPGAPTTETDGIELVTPERTADRATLSIVHHPDWELVGLHAAIGERGALLGRSPRACLPGAFEASKVSRKHAEVRVEDGVVLVEDQGSRNGTRVNGERVERSALRPGDVVGIGPILVMLTLGPASFTEPDDPHILGRSWPIAQLLDDLERAAESGHCVTLVGETGSGKELAAEAIHRQSERADGPLVAVNCSALSEGLIESELFGHEQGAFTGAGAAREGLVAHAEGGTLFLDEVTSTPPKLQAVMLRLLENGTYRTVGGNRQRRADVRVVAAAQPDIHDSIEKGGFRADLWYRLSRRIVDLPALRERRQDIPLLARHFAQQIHPSAELSPALSLALARADWSGNVRQLRNVVERIAEASVEPLLTDASHVPEAPPPSSPKPPKVKQRRTRRERPSRAALVKLLGEHEGRVAAAARKLGVQRKTLYRWLEAYDLDPDQLRPPE